MHTHPRLNIAIHAARIADGEIARNYEMTDTIKARKKGSDIVFTNLVYKIESLIGDIIHKTYPQDTILSEFNKEHSKLPGKDDDMQWVIDPLGGLTNCIKRQPHFAVSIAVRTKKKGTEVAVVYDPMRNELFTGIRGQGVQLERCRPRVTNVKNLNGTILATHSPFKVKKYIPALVSLQSKLSTQGADFRITGSTALDLAYVAAGRVDGFFGIGLKPWYFASGELLVRESGGMVTGFSGGNDYYSSGNIIAGNPKVVQTIASITREEKWSEALNT